MRYAVVTFLLVVSTCGLAQGVTLEGVNGERLGQQQTAMLVLGGWAVGNIGLGLALRSQTEGSTRRFHEMNALWNTVNLGIAAFGYYAALREPATLEAWESFAKQRSFAKVLVFNAGLDVGYVLGGLYLTERARRPDVDRDQLRGYGRSIVLQGAFLFVFDLANYFIATGREADYRLLFGAVGDGLGLQYTF